MGFIGTIPWFVFAGAVSMGIYMLLSEETKNRIKHFHDL